MLTFQLPIAEGRLTQPEQLIGYYQQILRSVESATGVQSAAAVTGMPLQGTNFGMPFTIAGQPAFADPSQRPASGFQMVTPDYFKTFGIHIVKGRAFTDQDTAATVRVAMVNEKFANHFFPGKNPLGQHLMVEQLVPGVTKLGPPQSVGDRRCLPRRARWCVQQSARRDRHSLLPNTLARRKHRGADLLRSSSHDEDNFRRSAYRRSNRSL